MNRFAFITVPSQELERPPAAAAILSSCVNSVGWDCKIFDFNLYLNNNIDSDSWVILETFWRGTLLELPEDVKEKLNVVINNFLSEVEDYAPNLIGLSVFTKMSVIAASKMLENIRSTMSTKIVLGGLGGQIVVEDLQSTEETNSIPFGMYAVNVGLADYYVQGDGEDALRALLLGNSTYPGINGIPPRQIEDLSALPTPNYTGIEPHRYYYTYEPGLYITATRGCVRNCTFCDIPQLWPKFKFRSSDNVVNEMIAGKKNYDVNLFHFTDSLVNGNLKVWREINQKIVEAKQQDLNLKPIKYLGQFICRTRMEQPEGDWALMAEAGADLFVVGFEHYSHRVRKHMGKNYSNADIDFHFAQSAKYGIKNIALMFVGYPTETIDDHECNIEFLHKFRNYARAGIIHMVRWGYTGMFMDTSDKVQSKGDVKIVTDLEFSKKLHLLPQNLREIALGFSWLNEHNPELTLRERIRRRLELHELSVRLGWPQTRNKEELQILFNILDNLNKNSADQLDFDALITLQDYH